VSDQLGGLDHFGALIESEKARAPAYAVVAAGPLFFQDMTLSGDSRAQHVAKAETLASSLRLLNLVAFAPGRNDWAEGSEMLRALARASGAEILAANVAETRPQGAPAAPFTGWTKKTIGGLTIGFVGVAAPDKASSPLESLTSDSPEQAVRRGVEALRREGASAIVVLAATGRGVAKRIADLNPDVLAIVVGSTGIGGETNTPPAPSERIGNVLIVETGNHLQTTAALDLHVRQDSAPSATAPSAALLSFADAVGIENLRKKEQLRSRIEELRTRVAAWEQDRTVSPQDLAARKDELRALELQTESVGKALTPPTGNFFRLTSFDIQAKLGKSEGVAQQIHAYYTKVNDDNKRAFASRTPVPAPAGTPSYIGIDACSTCHQDARAVWDKTAHAGAYATLERQSKEFNLDCVSCHVTGYNQPGGSTVTHVAKLKNVQCETCHGPGSLHAANPTRAKIPAAQPSSELCASCHHPPHVHAFDAHAKRNDILGPGHGLPKM